MSITIHWRPTSDEGKHFRGGTSSSFRVLADVFGHIITKADAPKLRAMETATKDAFYGEVAGIVEELGDIEFWDSY